MRALALIGEGIGPALLLPLTPPTMMGFAVLALLHLIGAFAARWLFFSQADHVVGLSDRPSLLRPIVVHDMPNM